MKLEAEYLSNKNNEFIPLQDIFYQLPFFACTNQILHLKYQSDVTKYLYCKDTGTAPYEGSYGETPKIWKQKHFLIKTALSILQHDQKEKILAKNKGK